MKNRLKFLLLLISFMLVPLHVHAANYKTLDLEGALAEEEIEKAFQKYEPNKDAITIYLFRGKGCGFCRAYLTFMNSIVEEYGQYFKMETYEVWNDSNNAALLDEVSTYLGQPAQGVPYIVIGDKVFGGYTSDYNDDIKSAITSLYKTKASKRYDVFKEMKKNPNKKNDSAVTSNSVIIWQFVFTTISTAIIMSYVNIKLKELKIKLTGCEDKKNGLDLKDKTDVKDKTDTKDKNNKKTRK